MSEPRISVIIPVRNEADKIERCLEAVFSQSLKSYEDKVNRMKEENSFKYEEMKCSP